MRPTIEIVVHPDSNPPLRREGGRGKVVVRRLAATGQGFGRSMRGTRTGYRGQGTGMHGGAS